MDKENDDLWSGHDLKRDNIVDIGQALLEVHKRFWIALQVRDEGVLRQCARWARSAADAMEAKAKEQEEYISR